MKTAICSIIKDEHRFLEEWIEWHLGLGFDAIHLFEDKDSKSHQGITDKYEKVYLRRYEDDEEVRNILEASGMSLRQLVLYDWFAKTYIDIYDWVAFIDLDEFVFFSPDYNLETLCEEFKSYPAVLLNWKMMGANGHIKIPEKSVIESYTVEGPFLYYERNHMFKSFCNLKLYSGFHNLHLAKDYVNTNHNPDIHDLRYDKAWLNHYFTKSWEDWCYRIFSRGDTQPGHRTLGQFFDLNPDMEYLREELINSMSEKRPLGTYWLDKKNGLISGGNINKLRKLSKKSIVQDNQRVLIIGNKPVNNPLSSETLDYIDSFDIIVRINGMNNLEDTGDRVDFWWLNIWSWKSIDENLGDRDYSSCKKVLLDNSTLRFASFSQIKEHLLKLRNVEFIKTGCSNTDLCFQSSYWIAKEEDKTIPTTSTIAISYFINKYSNADLYFTGLDIEGRDELFKSGSSWVGTWHENVGNLEADYLRKQIKNGRIKYLDLW